MKTLKEIRNLKYKSDEQLSERAFRSLTLASSATVLASTGKTIKSKLRSVKAAQSTEDKIDHLSDAMEILSTRITAVAALAYASANNNRRRGIK